MALACTLIKKNPAPLCVLAVNFIHSSHNQSTNYAVQKSQTKEEQKNDNKRWLTYNHTSKPTPESVRERNATVSSYYNQTAIDEASQKNSVRLTPSTIMYAGRSTDGSHIMKSAEYLRK